MILQHPEWLGDILDFENNFEWHHCTTEARLYKKFHIVSVNDYS